MRKNSVKLRKETRKKIREEINVGAGFHSCPEKDKGITLMALIITIIVMLILLAVTISILVKSNIIGIAENAADKTKTAYGKESNLGGKITIGGVEYDGINDYIQSKCSHNWGEWTVVKEPSYTEVGERNRECTKCGLEQTEYPSMLACDEHTYDENDWVIDTPATCKEKGLKYVICTKCNTRIEEEIEIDTENGHNFENGVCTICGESKSIKTEEFLREKLAEQGEHAAIDQYGNIVDLTLWRISYISNGTCYIKGEDTDGSGNLYYNGYSGKIKDGAIIGNIPAYVKNGENIYRVDMIGIQCFRDLKDLTYFPEIPFTVTSIGNSAFNGCSDLTNIEIPDSVTSIGGAAFIKCSGLTSIIVDVNNGVYDSRDNCNAIIKTDTKELIVGCRNTVIPGSITSIGSSAFSGCSSLTSIEIPEGVTSIGNFAFSDCDGLTSVEIPDSVTSIGEAAFNGCSSLTSIEIPDGVTSIGSEAFRGCSSLTSIEIPASVTSIENFAFFGCNSLTDVYYTGSEEDWSRISIDNDNAVLTGATIHYNHVIETTE